MKNKNLYLTILVVVLFSAVSFFAGKNLQSKKGGQMMGRGQFNGQMGRGVDMPQRAGQMRGGQITGEITSIESDKITIKEMDGSSKVILVNSDTSIVKTTTALNTDLKVGGRIAVFGKATTDAIISAQNIQINPQFRMMATPSATPKK